ncbi:MAG: hypothetical protein ACJ8R9_31060 [Steroidobacteraceae bacterium]
MPLDLDEAYALYEEWGPTRRTPISERLSRAYPDLSADQISDLIAQLAEVSKTVWGVAELGAETVLGKEKVVQILQSKHAFLTGEGLERAVFLANYYAMHEGYDKIPKPR